MSAAGDVASAAPTRTAVITGASVGIGLNAAGKLLARGCYNIVFAVRTPARGEEAAAKLRADHPSAPDRRCFRDAARPELARFRTSVC
jgi:NAD(P)-dependent dehydrogenase (short-subunit alcohol dehydrogenase family)